MAGQRVRSQPPAHQHGAERRASQQRRNGRVGLEGQAGEQADQRQQPPPRDAGPHRRGARPRASSQSAVVATSGVSECDSGDVTGDDGVGAGRRQQRGRDRADDAPADLPPEQVGRDDRQRPDGPGNQHRRFDARAERRGRPAPAAR